jgi:hypothetical protein
MKPWVKIGLVAAAFVLTAAVAAFLIGQGLNKAGTWATVLGLPIAILSAAAGVWSAVLAARTLREAHSSTVPVSAPLREAHVELVDAAVDPEVVAGISGSENTILTTERPTAEFTDIKPEVGAIDFKFINRGDAAAVLHQFTISILDFRLDTTPLLEYSYRLVGNRSHSDEFLYGTTLELEIGNFGWGSALGFTAALTCPVLVDLFPNAALSVDFAEVGSGANLIFTLLAEDADQSVMDRLRERRAAFLGKAVTALSDVDEELLRDPDFTTLLSLHEQWHIREFFSNYRHIDDNPRQQWHCDYIAELDSDYLPIRLDMLAEYADQNGRRKSEDAVALTSFDRSMAEGELWIGPTGFRYKIHHVSFMMMPGRDAYAVILDPENSGNQNYRISRSISPGDADRFHVVLASRMSGDFHLRLSFHINGTQVVKSNPLRITLNRPRNASLPVGISDGASFELRDGRLELGALLLRLNS